MLNVEYPRVTPPLNLSNSLSPASPAFLLLATRAASGKKRQANSPRAANILPIWCCRFHLGASWPKNDHHREGTRAGCVCSSSLDQRRTLLDDKRARQRAMTFQINDTTPPEHRNP